MAPMMVGCCRVTLWLLIRAKRMAKNMHVKGVRGNSPGKL